MRGYTHMNRKEREEKAKRDAARKKQDLREKMEMFVTAHYLGPIDDSNMSPEEFEAEMEVRAKLDLKWMERVAAMTDLELAKEYEFRGGPEMFEEEPNE
jgi:hypothetical protein